MSVDRFSVDCTRYMLDEAEIKSRTSSGENLRRQTRHPKLLHSRSDDNRRRSFDKHPKDPQSSRHSLNTPVVVECPGYDCEPKYFTTVSLDTEESRADNSEESRVADIDDANLTGLSPEGPTEADALLEEPELENVTEIDRNIFEHDNKRELHGSSSDVITMQRQNFTSEHMDSRTIVDDKTAQSQGQIEKCETTLYTEDDEV